MTQRWSRFRPHNKSRTSTSWRINPFQSR